MAMGSSQIIDDVPSYKLPFSSGFSQLATFLRLTPKGILKVLELMIFFYNVRSHLLGRISRDLQLGWNGTWRPGTNSRIESSEASQAFASHQNDDEKCETAM